MHVRVYIRVCVCVRACACHSVLVCMRADSIGACIDSVGGGGGRGAVHNHRHSTTHDIRIRTCSAVVRAPCRGQRVQNVPVRVRAVDKQQGRQWSEREMKIQRAERVSLRAQRGREGATDQSVLVCARDELRHSAVP